LDLFTTEGYHASTTPLIASRAGIAEGTIYRHFESKEQLLNEIYRAAVRLLAVPVNESPPSLNCRERLGRIAVLWQEIATANPPLVKLLFSADIDSLLDTSSRGAFADMLQQLEMVIVAGKSAGHVRAGSARIWADVWLRLLVLVLERIASGEWPPDHPGPQQVLDSAWTAIRAPTPSASL
jgi:AcrR family transcriptional regulator